MPPLQLDLAVLQASLADDHAERDADQIRVLELRTGPLISVVDQHVDPGEFETLGDLPGQPHHLAFGLDLQGDD